MNNKEIKVIDRFSWHKHHGDFAEKYLRLTYLPSLGLGFRKIRKDKKGKKPEGYVLDNKKQRIALIEIKLIRNQKREPRIIHLIKLDETIQRSIRSAKTQLKTIDTDLPKILYIIRDDIFLKPETFRQAIFGKWITVCCGKKTIFNDYSGFYFKSKQDNKMRDDFLSAIICFIPTLRGHTLWVYKNKKAKALPYKLLDKKHVEELWEYDSKSLKRTI